MKITELKNRIIKAIDDNKESIIKAGRDIYATPEMGYKEVKSTKTTSDFLKDLGLDVEENIAVTGCRARLNKKSNGPKVALMGELDSVAVGEHPDAKENGNVHACGHNIQMGGLLGAAVGLVKSGVLKELDGKIDIIATPAEEFIELEYREQLRAEGKITYFGGKQELIKKGSLDDVDMSIMFHSLDLGENKALIGPVSNGFIGKKIQFKGREAHAGSAPYDGINALNAAMLAMNNIHAQRETFKEADRVRVHPIITKGGDIVNVVPADVRMESYVRARTIEGMLDANIKVNRALQAGAMAIGADIEITEIPGYLPILRHDNMETILNGNLEELGLEGKIVDGGDFTGSFDFGDVSHLMPTLHPMIGGVKGGIHTKDFKIVDEDLAYIVPAKAMAMTIVDLLFDGAKEAKTILDNFTPVMTKDEYLSFMESNDKVITANFS